MRRMLIASLALGLLLPASAGAVTKEVTISANGTAFTPDKVRVGPGGNVRWTKDAGAISHNVREDGQLFRSGGLTSGPIDFTVTFSAGKFHYYCENHGSPSGGMDGVVKVPVKIRPAPNGPPFKVIWATGASETGSRYDVKYRVGGGSWKIWKRNVTGNRAVFGKGGNPVQVSDGTTYAFRARSKEGSVKSRWSPKRSFTA